MQLLADIWPVLALTAERALPATGATVTWAVTAVGATLVLAGLGLITAHRLRGR